MEKLYTTDEVAELLRVTRWTVYRYIRRGKLNAVRMGKRLLRVSESSVQKLLSEA